MSLIFFFDSPQLSTNQQLVCVKIKKCLKKNASGMIFFCRKKEFTTMCFFSTFFARSVFFSFLLPQLSKNQSILKVYSWKKVAFNWRDISTFFIESVIFFYCVCFLLFVKNGGSAKKTVYLFCTFFLWMKFIKKKKMRTICFFIQIWYHLFVFSMLLFVSFFGTPPINPKTSMCRVN